MTGSLFPLSLRSPRTADEAISTNPFSCRAESHDEWLKHLGLRNLSLWQREIKEGFLLCSGSSENPPHSPFSKGEEKYDLSQLPYQPPPAQQVDMDVLHHLASLRPAVDGHSITLLVHVFPAISPAGRAPSPE
jgi:hypothetical protein